MVTPVEQCEVVNKPNETEQHSFVPEESVALEEKQVEPQVESVIVTTITKEDGEAEDAVVESTVVESTAIDGTVLEDTDENISKNNNQSFEDEEKKKDSEEGVTDADKTQPALDKKSNLKTSRDNKDSSPDKNTRSRVLD